MYYNGKHGKHVETFLNEVHAAANARYNALSNADAVNAQKLQNFFQELKMAATNKKNNKDIVYNMFLDDLLNDIEAIAKKRSANYKIENLFKRRGKNSQEQGLVLERELTDVIEVLKQTTELPVAIGFGINTVQQAEFFSKMADGIIIGNAIVKLVEKNGKESAIQVFEYIKNLKEVM